MEQDLYNMEDEIVPIDNSKTIENCQEIERILKFLTEKLNGERFFNPGFGIPVSEYLFDNEEDTN